MGLLEETRLDPKPLLKTRYGTDGFTKTYATGGCFWSSDALPPPAVLQSIARKNVWALDRMTLTVDITKKTREDFGHPPREGAYIHGLFMEGPVLIRIHPNLLIVFSRCSPHTSCLAPLAGARWDTQAGVMSEAVVRELTPAMPVLYVRAAPAEEQELQNTYACPVYRTKRRGPTYVWTLHLQTRQPAARWTLAGVALLLSV